MRVENSELYQFFGVLTIACDSSELSAAFNAIREENPDITAEELLYLGTNRCLDDGWDGLWNSFSAEHELTLLDEADFEITDITAGKATIRVFLPLLPENVDIENYRGISAEVSTVTVSRKSVDKNIRAAFERAGRTGEPDDKFAKENGFSSLVVWRESLLHDADKLSRGNAEKAAHGIILDKLTDNLICGEINDELVHFYYDRHMRYMRDNVWTERGSEEKFIYDGWRSYSGYMHYMLPKIERKLRTRLALLVIAAKEGLYPNGSFDEKMTAAANFVYDRASITYITA